MRHKIERGKMPRPRKTYGDPILELQANVSAEDEIREELLKTQERTRSTLRSNLEKFVGLGIVKLTINHHVLERNGRHNEKMHEGKL